MPGAFAASWTSGACNRGFVVEVAVGAGRARVMVSVVSETSVDFLILPLIESETTVDFIVAS